VDQLSEAVQAGSRRVRPRMHIDPYTVILFGLLLKVPLAVLFLAFWLRGRRASWFAWWSATLFLGSVAMLCFLVGGLRKEYVPIGAANAVLAVALVCAWQGARAFEKRAPRWLPVFAVPGVWLAACLVPGFVECLACRVTLSSTLLSPVMALTAAEFWRGREERLPSRGAVIVLFASLALIFAARIPLIGVAPFPFGALPAEAAWVAAYNLILLFHAVVLAVLLVAMSKERLELEQRTRAQTDPLTGALNRRAFVTIGRRLVLRHRKSLASLCLLFIDLDHFKALNDRYGHSCGDALLMWFVTVAQDKIRPTDFLFRMGGEEFCCVLPYTSTEEALGVAERIRHQLETATLEVAGRSIKVTVSVGVSSTDMVGYDMDSLVRRADTAVYAAKRQGRNRVVAAAADDVRETGGPILAADDEMVAAGRSPAWSGSIAGRDNP
jgi:diguanylate cyclase (GGDEF)-like protein